MQDFAAAVNAAGSTSRSPSTSSGDGSTAVTVPSPSPDPAKLWDMGSVPTDPLLDGAFSAPANSLFMGAVTTVGDFGNTNLIAFSGIGITGPDLRKRKTVTVDVNVLIYGMCSMFRSLTRALWLISVQR